MQDDTSLLAFFRHAKRCVDQNGYRTEYEYQKSIIGEPWFESDFLREYSWVVLSCGFRERVVRRWFSYISLAFFDFSSAKRILAHKNQCKRLALLAINNEAKIDGIIQTAAEIDAEGFDSFRTEVFSNPTGRLTILPYIGNITCRHLLKNLGFDVAKNDRHLRRISHHFQFGEASQLCERISSLTGEPRAVVDVILWRHAVIRSESFNERTSDAVKRPNEKRLGTHY